MIAWCLANPQLAFAVASFVAYVVLSILGAALPIDPALDQMLPNDKARLNGFPEADFVSK